MAKSKWESVRDKLELVEAWCRDGLIEEEIAKKLNIGMSTLSKYKVEHVELVEALKRGKEVIDYEVEQKLLKRAMGYDYDEVTKENLLNPITNEFGLEVTKVVRKHVLPDTTAQIFWLKNRKPKEWRDKRDIEMSGETTVNNNIDLTGYTTDQLKEMLKE